MSTDKRPLTPDAIDALRKFWWHMMKRIKNDANIQYYCGAMTETLRLGVEVWHLIYPEYTPEELERRLLERGVSEDADVLRLRARIDELEQT